MRLKDDPEALIFTKKNGTAILRFDKAWWTACRAAGIPDRVEKRTLPNGKEITKVTCGRIFHDFRRTAVRNLENAGVPRSQAIRLVGHKTEAIYNRYAISNENDLRRRCASWTRLRAEANWGVDKRPGYVCLYSTVG